MNVEAMVGNDCVDQAQAEQQILAALWDLGNDVVGEMDITSFYVPIAKIINST